MANWQHKSRGRPPRPAATPPLHTLSAAWHAAVVAGMAAGKVSWRRGAGALLANHAVLSLAGCLPRSPLLGPNLTSLPAGTPRCPDVALSFDDGPDPDVTPRVAEILEDRGLRGSFFCIGRRLRRYPEVARDLAARGHTLENHTWRHRSTFAVALRPSLRREIGAAQKIATEIAGRPPAWFRAPAGVRNPLLEGVLAEAGLHYASWTRRGFDTVDPNPGTVLDRLIDGLGKGDVLLLHDGNSARDANGRPVVLEVLPRLLDYLEAFELRAGPLPEPEDLPEPWG
ncbi:MAG: polysaccharide deacetylase family protein [Acidobacteriota bacterium]